MKWRFTVLVLVLVSFGAFAFSPLQDDLLRGFTKSPSEHIINESAEKITVALVQGIILDPSLAPIPNAIFEIRGPGKSEHVRGGKTDKNGRFKLNNVPEGTYMYKATMDGFQSEVGTIVVSKAASKRNSISVHMDVGV